MKIKALKVQDIRCSTGETFVVTSSIAQAALPAETYGDNRWISCVYSDPESEEQGATIFVVASSWRPAIRSRAQKTFQELQSFKPPTRSQQRCEAYTLGTYQ